MKDILERYKVKLRSEPQTVKHNTYGFETVLQPEDFAIYEAALKANFIACACQTTLRNARKKRELFECAVANTEHLKQLMERDGIAIPWLGERWGQQKSMEASNDYRHCCGELSKRTGRDAKTGDERNLYRAVLD